MIRDGIHSWLEGSKHVAYGDGKYDAQGAKCPPTHPKRIMSLLFEFTFVVRSLVSSFLVLFSLIRRTRQNTKKGAVRLCALLKGLR